MQPKLPGLGSVQGPEFSIQGWIVVGIIILSAAFIVALIIMWLHHDKKNLDKSRVQRTNQCGENTE